MTQTGAVQAAGGRRRVGSRLILAAWLVGLGAVVGVAALGRMASPEAVPQAAVIAVPIPTAVGVPGDSPSPEDASTTGILVLSSPAEANATITTRQLSVRGYLQTGAGTVRVTLEARGNRIIEDATVRPALVFGERPVANRHAQFAVSFALPNPRPNGRMVVQVAAYDADGALIDVVRRPIQVGALVDRPLGEDGLVGGLVFGGG